MSTKHNDQLNRTIINVSHAKAHLSALLDQVADGHKLILGKAGKPIALLIPYSEKKKKRTFGALQGQIQISEDFEFNDQELEELFGIE